MNELKGIVAEVEVNGSLSLVKVNVTDVMLSAMVIDTPETVDYLQSGKTVYLIFKETEVMIGKGIDHPVSLQNKLPGLIKHIEVGELLSKITLQTSVGEIISIITTYSLKKLALQLEDEVTAMIKTNEMMLSE